MPKHTFLRVTYRFVSGRPLDGVARTNSTYLHRGTKPLTVTGRTTRWAMLPGWKRQMVRLSTPAVVTASGYGYAAQPTLSTAAALTLAALGAAHGVRRARRAWRMRRFNAVYIRPTLAAIAPAVGDTGIHLHVSPELGDLAPRLAKPMSPAELTVRAWYGRHLEPVVRWAPDRIWRGQVVALEKAKPVLDVLAKLRRPVPALEANRVQLRVGVPYLTSEQRKYISSVISAKIPVANLVESWDLVGEQVTATWTVRRRPPTRATLADLEARWTSLAESEFFVGLGVGGQGHTISLEADSPHIACSAGSGAGKSVLAQLIGVQVLARGGRVVILDRKGSHRWALGLPNVDYCTTPEKMHAALVELAALADERNARALHEAEGWDPGHRVLLIAEELNATFSQLRDFWDEVRGKGDPKVSPAVRGFRNILFMGRAAKVNCFAVAQMLTAVTTGGPEARENFGIRALARYSANAWKMLCPECSMPRASRTLGRWQFVVGGVATEVQVAYLTAREARMFVVKMSPETASGLMAPEVRKSPGQAPVGDMPTDPLSEPVTLRQAVEAGIIPGRFDAAKKRLQRARRDCPDRAPTPVGKSGLADTYRLGDLIAWSESERV